MQNKEIINKEVFDKETAMCKKLFKENGGCACGKCKDCGVIPLLYKLHTGQLLEKSEEIEEIKNRILNK